MSVGLGLGSAWFANGGRLGLSAGCEGRYAAVQMVLEVATFLAYKNYSARVPVAWPYAGSMFREVLMNTACQPCFPSSHRRFGCPRQRLC